MLTRRIIFLLVAIIINTQTVYAASFVPTASKGVLNLSQSSLSEIGIVKLDGEWLFYWEQLYNPSELHSVTNDGIFIPVPRSWNRVNLDRGPFPAYGYATYRLDIQLHPEDVQKKLAISAPYEATAYRLWVDGELVAENGVVGTDRTTTSPEYRSRLVSFVPETETIKIVVQVANFHHREGGLRNSILFGYHEQLETLRIQKQAKDMFLFGGILMMALYNAALYYWLRKLSPLFLGLFSLTISLRTLFTGEHMFQWFLPNIAWETQLKIENLTAYIAMPAFTAFMQSLYPLDMSLVSVIGTAILGAFGAFVTIVTPIRVSTALIPIYELALLFCVYKYMHVAWLATRRRRMGSWAFTFGGIIFSITIIHDILNYRNLGIGMDLTPFGLFLFLLFQSFILAEKFSSAEFHSRFDYLVKKPNRRELENILREEIAKAERGNHPFSLILLDIDRFKLVNDTHGHDAGDRVLQDVCQLLNESIRSTDVLGRWGGEEFLIIIPGASLEQARWVAEKLRNIIANNNFDQVGHVTISFGVTCYQTGDTIESLIKRADNALYEVKALGGNHVKASM